jgi:DNA modification methylase
MTFIDTILEGNNIETLKKLPDKSVDCCVTSPPYYHLRTYNIDNEIGQEDTVAEYITKLIGVFREVNRVLKPEGTLWLNLGDSYSGSGNGTNDYRTGDHIRVPLKGQQGGSSKDKTFPAKNLCGVPWRAAFALQEDGWILRQDIIWAKPSVMPESVKDRFCKSHEYVFLFVKNSKYYFNREAALEIATGYAGRKDTVYKTADYDKTVFRTGTPGRERWTQRGYAGKEGNPALIGQTPQHHGSAIKPRYFGKTGNPDRKDTGNPFIDVPLRTKRDVWTIASEPSREGHYAMYPQRLVLQCLLCGCPEGGIVLDPFLGSGTTAIVAKKNNRHFIGCELNPEYVEMARRRLSDVNPLFENN